MFEGTSFTPNKGIQHQITPPTTSVKDNNVNSAAGIAFEPIEYKIKPMHTRVPCTEKSPWFLLDDKRLRASQKVLKQVLNGSKLLDDGTKAIKVYRQAQVQQLMATKFLEILGSGITAKGSGQDAYNGVKNTLGFIIGFGNIK